MSGFRRPKPTKPRVTNYPTGADPEGYSAWAQTRVPDKPESKTPFVIKPEHLNKAAEEQDWEVRESEGSANPLQVADKDFDRLRPHNRRKDFRHGVISGSHTQPRPGEYLDRNSGQSELKGRYTKYPRQVLVAKTVKKETEGLKQGLTGSFVDTEMLTNDRIEPTQATLRRAFGDPSEIKPDQLVHSTDWDGEGDDNARVDGLNEPETRSEIDARKQEKGIRHFGQSRFGRG